MPDPNGWIRIIPYGHDPDPRLFVQARYFRKMVSILSDLALESGYRSEETAACAIGAMTAPILAIHARQSFLVRNNLL
jgi:hypothetical protein